MNFHLLRALLLFVLAILSASVFAQAGGGVLVPGANPYSPPRNLWQPAGWYVDPFAVSRVPTAGGVDGIRTITPEVTSPNGTKVSVPVQGKVSLGSAGLALKALMCLPPYSPIGIIACVSTVAEVLKELDEHGTFGRCPDGSADFICKPSGDLSDGKLYRAMDSGNGWTAWDTWLASPELACRNLAQLRTQYGVNTTYSYGSSTATTCTMPWVVSGGGSGTMVKNIGSQASSCPIGWYVASGGGCTQDPDLVPTSAADLQAEMNRILFQESNLNKSLWEAMASDQRAHPDTFPPSASPVDATTPVATVAPPVTSAPREISRQTVSNADGTSSTVVDTEVVTVTPKVTGSTAGDTAVTYPSTSTITTVTTNNTTGATTTNSTITNNAAPDPTPDPCDAHPDRAGCSLLGSPPDPEAIPKVESPVSYSPVSFASSASCPSDIGFSAMGHTYAISYAPMCDLMTKLRPLFLALGAAAAAWIFMDGLRL